MLAYRDERVHVREMTGSSCHRAAAGFLILLCGIACGAAEDGALESRDDSVVFGTNDLVEFAAVADPRLKKLADATAGMFLGDTVRCEGGTCELSLVQPFNQASTPTANPDVPGGPFSRSLCPGERFENQLAGAVCSAFLVGADLFATAGHCLCSNGACGCNGRKVAFGFKSDAAGQNTQWHVPEADVYTCTGTPAARYANGEDWAFFRVDRPVASRAPMIIQRTGELLKGELAGVGHPNGLPLKVARNGQVKVDSPTETFTFSANLDSSLGSSGGPVIDTATGVVTGIHVTAPYWNYIDGQTSSGSLCAKTNTCSATTGCDPYFLFSPWGGETRMTYAAAQGRVPLHAALIVAALM
jgi:hypothetical protein